MKKFSSVIITIALVFSFTGCKKEEKPAPCALCGNPSETILYASKERMDKLGIEIKNYTGAQFEVCSAPICNKCAKDISVPVASNPLMQ